MNLITHIINDRNYTRAKVMIESKSNTVGILNDAIIINAGRRKETQKRTQIHFGRIDPI